MSIPRSAARPGVDHRHQKDPGEAGAKRVIHPDRHLHGGPTTRSRTLTSVRRRARPGRQASAPRRTLASAARSMGPRHRRQRGHGQEEEQECAPLSLFAPFRLTFLAVCCIYHKPRPFDESSSESGSDSDSSCDHDHGRRHRRHRPERPSPEPNGSGREAQRSPDATTTEHRPPAPNAYDADPSDKGKGGPTAPASSSQAHGYAGKSPS